MYITPDFKQKFQVYPLSIHELSDRIVCMAKGKSEDFILVFGQDSDFVGTTKSYEGTEYKECPLTRENAEALKKLFPFTRPVPVLKTHKTIGLGDRLGRATAGHIKLMKDFPYIRPVFAQQSMRELNLTGRRYEDVIADAVFAVFRENYTLGYGADGDHLKTEEDIRYALDCGCTMITLDCSDHINNAAASYDDDAVNKEYKPDADLESRYVGKTFTLKNGMSFTFTENEFRRIVLIYKEAIDFAVKVYNDIFRGNQNADLEVSIDETLTPTTPLQHFFVANELKHADALPVTMAPRFCGEFQKGIDYIGDIKQFEKEFEVHANIAKEFGYKISVHSGSDKFATFSIVGKYTDGIYHVKTAGTNWLEAMRVVAQEDPSLYREVHKFALSVLPEARKYYHIGADENTIPDVDTLPDSELPNLMSRDNSRQVIHITYGLILQAKNPDGTSRFRDRLYQVWHDYEETYHKNLYNHIRRHITELGN